MHFVRSYYLVGLFKISWCPVQWYGRDKVVTTGRQVKITGMFVTLPSENARSDSWNTGKHSMAERKWRIDNNTFESPSCSLSQWQNTLPRLLFWGAGSPFQKCSFGLMERRQVVHSMDNKGEGLFDNTFVQFLVSTSTRRCHWHSSCQIPLTEFVPAFQL